MSIKVNVAKKRYLRSKRIKFILPPHQLSYAMKHITLTVWLLALLSLTSLNIEAQDLYDVNTVRTIKIDFENPTYDSTLKAGWFAKNGHREIATLEMNGTIYDSVAIRYKGNSTFFIPNQSNNPKIPLNIDMNEYIDNQDLLGVNKIKLANGFFDPTMVREVLAGEIYRNYMPAPEVNHMQVYIEGKYVGLYANTESINKDFFKKHFDYKKGVLFKCDPTAQYGSSDPFLEPDLQWYGTDSTAYLPRYDLKSNTGWRELLNLIDVINQRPQEIEDVLNVDRALWYLAVSTVIANYDTYNGIYVHNYYLYLHENGQFQVIPWDLSESFIGALLGADGLSANDLYAFDPLPIGKGRPLMDLISNNLIYKRQYYAHIRTILNEVMDRSLLNTAIDSLQNRIATAMAADPYAFLGLGDTYFRTNVQSDLNLPFIQIGGILKTVDGRKNYLLNHPEINNTPPAISQVSSSSLYPQTGEKVYVTATIAHANLAQLMVTKSKYASHFEPIAMRDDGMHDDGAAGDGVFGAEIPFQDKDDEVKYYVRALNQDAMTLNPERAEYVFYEYTVGQAAGIDENTLPAISIYPNPSHGTFFISLQNPIVGQNLQADLYDLNGKKIGEYALQPQQGKWLLDISDNQAGVYFLKIDNKAPVKVVLLR